MKIFSTINNAESESINETIESMEKRIDRLKEREREGEDTVMYRGEEVSIGEAIDDLEDRVRALERLNEE